MRLWRDTAQLKANAVSEYVSDLLEAGCEKFLVFAHHRDMLDKVEEKVRRREHWSWQHLMRLAVHRLPAPNPTALHAVWAAAGFTVMLCSARPSRCPSSASTATPRLRTARRKSRASRRTPTCG